MRASAPTTMVVSSANMSAAVAMTASGGLPPGCLRGGHDWRGACFRGGRPDVRCLGCHDDLLLRR
jgi:hypothetical protein